MSTACHYSSNDASLDGSVDTSDTSNITDDVYKQVVSLLKLVISSAARSAEASALLMDELATVIQKGCLNRQVEVGATLATTGESIHVLFFSWALSLVRPTVNPLGYKCCNEILTFICLFNLWTKYISLIGIVH